VWGRWNMAHNGVLVAIAVYIWGVLYSVGWYCCSPDSGTLQVCTVCKVLHIFYIYFLE
jgi:hypothetical protein